METNKIYQGDSEVILKNIGDNTIDLTVTSPPYDDLRTYTGNSIPWNSQKFMGIADELVRVTKPGGIIVWVVGDKTENGGETGTSFKQALYFMERGMKLNDTMIWCLGGATNIYAKTQKMVGVITIKDLVRLDPKTVKLWNGEKWVDVIGFRENTSVTEKFQIELRSGERIYCTPEHIWPTLNRGNVNTSELKVGDILKSCRLPDSDSHNPIYLTKDILWLIGLYIAEGSHSKHGKVIQISLNSDEIHFFERIKTAITSIGGTSQYTIDGNKLNVRIYSNIFEAILQKYVGGKTSHDKHLRNVCWEMKNELLKEIMNGYLDGDGSYDANNNRWRLGFTDNRYLESTIRTIAARLGAKLTILPRKAKCLGKAFDSLKGEWRWAFSNHHNSKNRCEILSIKKVKVKKDESLWDIEVDSDDHLFSLASGVLTHNCKTNPLPQVRQPRYNQCFEYMFVFSKGKPNTFNPIMIPTKCGGQHYKSTGKVITKDNKRRELDYHVNKEKVDNNIWPIAVARNQKDGDLKHPAVFPYEIPYRHIKTWTNKGDLVLDPFAGSGTTLLAAKDLDRQYIGIECVPEYVELMKSKL